MSNKDVTGAENLYISILKCKKNVSRKASAQSYYLNAMRNTLVMNKELRNGTYKPKPTRNVEIYYPKRRHAVANAFRDRVYQRSLNDVALYPQVVSHFIPENMACQKGKGTLDALYLFRDTIHNEWRRNGGDVWILQGDIQHYYDSMRHSYTDEVFERFADKDTSDRARKVLHDQYKGDVGYNPGSQMVQIAGISYLDYIDHYAKDVLRIKSYIRYMDDIEIVHGSREKLAEFLRLIGNRLSETGLHWHPQKTKIVPASKGVLFLGFCFRLTETGKVVMTVDPEKLRCNRRKVHKMAVLVGDGLISREAFDSSVSCMIAHMAHGDSYRAIQKFKDYCSKEMERYERPS